MWPRPEAVPRPHGETLVLMSGLAPGGAERITLSFLRHLQERGRGVPLCTVTARHDGPLSKELATAGIVRFDLGARRLADPLALGRLWGLLSRERFDLVHAHGQDAAVLAHWARRLRRFRLVITRHVVEEPSGDWRQRARACAAASALGAADAVVAVSRSAATRLSELGSVRPTRIDVIPNGIDTARFDPAANAAPGGALRRELGVGEGSPVVLMPALLRPGKGHDVLFEAVPRVRDRVPGATFLLAGAGELEWALERRAEPLRGAVRLLGYRDDIPALMAAADVVCLPSRSEALPTVLLEAAAAGRPAVASRVGGIPEVVEDGRTGLLVASSNPGELAEALTVLLREPSRRGELGRAALEKARREFTLESQVRRTAAVWQRVLRERGR